MARLFPLSELKTENLAAAVDRAAVPYQICRGA